MRILVFGTGVIGTIYGYALSNTGNEVIHYVRPGKKDYLVNGIKINLLDARNKKKPVDISDVYPINAIDYLPSFDEFDLVIVSVRHYELSNILPLLSDKLGKADLLFFNNLWTDFSSVDQYLPRNKYLWGFPVAGGSYDAGKSLLSGVLLSDIHLGETDGTKSHRVQRIAQMFKNAHINVILQNNIQHWLWVHFALIAGLISSNVKSGGTTNFLNSIANIQQGVLCVREGFDICKARGVDIKSIKEASPFYLPSRIAAFAIWMMMKLDSPARKSMELYNGGEELNKMFFDLFDTGEKLKVNMPNLRAMKPYF